MGAVVGGATAGALSTFRPTCNIGMKLGVVVLPIFTPPRYIERVHAPVNDQETFTWVAEAAVAMTAVGVGAMTVTFALMSRMVSATKLPPSVSPVA